MKFQRDNALLIEQARELAQRGKIQRFVVVQTEARRFIVLLHLKGKPELAHLVTIREPIEPREFMRIDVVYRVLSERIGSTRPILVLSHPAALELRKLRADLGSA